MEDIENRPEWPDDLMEALTAVIPKEDLEELMKTQSTKGTMQIVKEKIKAAASEAAAIRKTAVVFATITITIMLLAAKAAANGLDLREMESLLSTLVNLAARTMRKKLKAAANEAAALWKSSVGIATIIIKMMKLAAKAAAKEHEIIQSFRGAGKSGKPKKKGGACRRAGKARKVEKQRRHRVSQRKTYTVDAEEKKRLGYVLWALQAARETAKEKAEEAARGARPSWISRTWNKLMHIIHGNGTNTVGQDKEKAEIADEIRRKIREEEVMEEEIDKIRKKEDEDDREIQHWWRMQAGEFSSEDENLLDLMDTEEAFQRNVMKACAEEEYNRKVKEDEEEEIKQGVILEEEIEI